MKDQDNAYNPGLEVLKTLRAHAIEEERDLDVARLDGKIADIEARQSRHVMTSTDAGYARAAYLAERAIATRHSIETIAKTDVDAALFVLQRRHHAVQLADRDGTESEQAGTRRELREAIEHYRVLLLMATHEERTTHRERLIAGAITEEAILERQHAATNSSAKGAA